jgi:hypothetical protein
MYAYILSQFLHSELTYVSNLEAHLGVTVI